MSRLVVVKLCKIKTLVELHSSSGMGCEVGVGDGAVESESGR